MGETAIKGKFSGSYAQIEGELLIRTVSRDGGHRFWFACDLCGDVVEMPMRDVFWFAALPQCDACRQDPEVQEKNAREVRAALQQIEHYLGPRDR